MQLKRYALLARSVAGCPVAIAGGVDRSYTDGETIFLADLDEPWLTAAVVIQSSLIAAGSLRPEVVIRLIGRQSTRLRYLTLEASRATALVGLPIPMPVRKALGEVYGGPLPGGPDESLAWAMSTWRQIPEAPDWLGTLKPITVLRTAGVVGGAPLGENGDRAIPRARQPQELDDAQEPERSRILELFSAPIPNPIAALIQRLFGAGRVPESGTAGAELPVGETDNRAVGRNARLTRARPQGQLEVSVRFGRRYPEWDYRRGRYRLDWCAVTELDPPSPPPDLPASSIPRTDERLRVALARLAPAPERHRRQLEGEALDIAALVELVVDRAAGREGDPRVYETKRKTGHDLGALILLDATGSTAESTQGLQVFDQQRELAGRLTAVLDELGDRVATYAFYSHGREAIRFLRVKDFDNHYDFGARRRLQTLSPNGYTRLGAAIRHGAHILRTRAGTPIKLLMLIGDGLPYEDGYEHRYAEEDSRKALSEAVASGVGCACISVCSSTTDDVLERVWGEVPHRQLADPAAIHREAKELFGEAIKAAARSRRSIGQPVVGRGY